MKETLEQLIANNTAALEACTAAMEENTALMSAQGNATDDDGRKTPTKKTQAKKKPADDEQKKTPTKKTQAKKKPADDDDGVSEQDVKDLAKKKMAEGVKRTDIKDMIEELDANSIADLDAPGRQVLFANLSKLGETAEDDDL